MDKTKNFFIKIDEFIFHKIDLLKNDSSFQKINEYLSGIEEDQQKIMAQALTFSLILLPFLFVALLWWGNHKTKKEYRNQKSDSGTDRCSERKPRYFKHGQFKLRFS